MEENGYLHPLVNLSPAKYLLVSFAQEAKYTSVLVWMLWITEKCCPFQE
jgi:hypothetical protein